MAVPIPLSDPIARPRREDIGPDQKDPNQGTITLPWIQYFQAQSDTFSQAPIKTTTPVSLSNQSASIGSTPIPTASLASGLYRVSYAARVSQSATTSSSLTVTISWTASGVTQAQSGAAMTGNTTATFQSHSYLILIDQASPVTYYTTYASVGATPMKYELSVVLESIDA